MAGRRTSSGKGTRRSEAPVVLDSWAILAWLQGEEPANRIVKRVLKEAEKIGQPALLTAVNLGEVFTCVIHERGLEIAERTRKDLRQAPIRVEAVREPLAWRAGAIKASYTLSYADAFAAALALERGGILYTGDPEFKPLEAAEGLRVHWLIRDGK
jgi:predicted nucleic acid-binding protein